MADERICIVNGCCKQAKVRGYCQSHYLRWHRHGDPTAGGPFLSPRGEPLRWLKENLSYASAECLHWPFGKNKTGGYGVVKVGKRQVFAHRWMCEQLNGPAPDQNSMAAHFCGNRSCVNPTHLRWATPKENSDDKVVHGTTIRGRSPNAKVTADDVRQIRELRGKMSQPKIGQRFGLKQSQVSAIQTGRDWAWLKD